MNSIVFDDGQAIPDEETTNELLNVRNNNCREQENIATRTSIEPDTGRPHLLTLPFEIRAYIFSLVYEHIHIHVSSYRTSAQELASHFDVLPYHHPPPITHDQCRAQLRHIHTISYRHLTDVQLHHMDTLRDPIDDSMFHCPLCPSIYSTPNTSTRLPNHTSSYPLTPAYAASRQLHAEFANLPFNSRHNIVSFSFERGIPGLLERASAVSPVRFPRVREAWLSPGTGLGIDCLVSVARECLPSVTVIRSTMLEWLKCKREVEREDVLGWPRCSEEQLMFENRLHGVWFVALREAWEMAGRELNIVGEEEVRDLLRLAG